MKIYRITDSEFKIYGKTIGGYDVAPFLSALKSTQLPDGTEYVTEEAALQSLPEAMTLGNALFGGLPAQFGWCNGHNTKLNCLEFHRNSEFLLGTEDFILLIAKQDEIVNGTLDTDKVKAFLAPAGVLVELYATTLHYAPCCTDTEKGFRVMIALPKGTNTAMPEMIPITPEDKMLRACNKWLLAHPDSDEAKDGAWIGLSGSNIDIEN
ncbi:MAG: DUF4867 family protein [Oscillospiraceae bacterium]|nr:DUF4867 family protein [Oscillospiraceae bacterium]